MAKLARQPQPHFHLSSAPNLGVTATHDTAAIAHYLFSLHSGNQMSTVFWNNVVVQVVSTILFLRLRDEKE